MDKDMLINSMDFNFMSILSHALWNGTRLSAELILAYVDNQKCMTSNYDLIMQNYEKLLDSNMGNCLGQFLDDQSSSTNIRIVADDERLDPNQFKTTVDFFIFDHHPEKGNDQIVHRFNSLIREEKAGEEEPDNTSFKVSYQYIDFTPLIYQRKLDKI